MSRLPTGIRLRLFGLSLGHGARIEEQVRPYTSGLTVGGLWAELQQRADPRAPMASLQREMVLALVNGTPIQRLEGGWDTPLADGDTVTFMVKAFGG